MGEKINFVFVNNLAQSKEVISVAKNLVKSKQTPSNLIEHPAQKKIRSVLNKTITTAGYIGFFIISKDRIILASMRDG